MDQVTRELDVMIDEIMTHESDPTHETAISAIEAVIEAHYVGAITGADASMLRRIIALRWVAAEHRLIGETEVARRAERASESLYSKLRADLRRW